MNCDPERYKNQSELWIAVDNGSPINIWSFEQLCCETPPIARLPGRVV